MLRRVVAGLLMVAALGQFAAAAAGEAVSVALEPQNGSETRGTATLNAVGAGTRISLEVDGLDSGTRATGRLHAGTCSSPSASAAPLPELVADPSGRAAATGPVLFRGTDPVELSSLVDGGHALILETDSRVVACGTVSASRSAAPPRTGGAAPGEDAESTPWVVAGAVALVVITGSAVFLVRRGKPR